MSLHTFARCHVDKIKLQKLKATKLDETIENASFEELVNKLNIIDEKIDRNYDEKKRIKELIVDKLGIVTKTYQLEKPTEDDEKYLRVTVKDNLELFQTGEPLYRVARFERFDIELKFLKREPKE